MPRAKDSTIEGISRAIDEAQGFLDESRNTGRPLLDALPLIFNAQALALNRLTDVVESLETRLVDLEGRLRSLENDR